MSEDRNLHLTVTAQGRDQGAEELVRRLRRELTQVGELQASLAAVSTRTAEAARVALERERQSILNKLNDLGALEAATNRVAAAAAKSGKEFETSSAMILRAQRALDPRAVETFMGRAFSTSELIKAQRAVESFVAQSGRSLTTTETLRAQRGIENYVQSVGVATAAELAEQAKIHNAGLQDLERRAQIASEIDNINQRQHAKALQENERFEAQQRAIRDRARTEAERSAEYDLERRLQMAFRAENAARLAADAASAGSGGGGWFSRFMRGGRTPIALMDEMARGQKGAELSTFGAGIRAAGIGGAGAGAVVGGVVAVGATTALVKSAEHMGKWAESIRSGAQAAGMSIKDYSRLQGALELTGMKAGAASSTLRAFATNIEHAMADPASRAAKAFNAIGISQQELTKSGGNTEQMLLRVIERLSEYGDSATKAAAEQAIFNRSSEELGPAINRGKEGFIELMQTASKLGLELDEKTAKSLIETGEKVILLAKTIEGNAIRAFLAWKPEIEAIIDVLGGLLNVVISVTTAIGNMVSSISKGFASLEAETAKYGSYDPNSGLFIPNSQLPHLPGNEATIPPKTTLPDVNVAAKPKVAPFDVKAGRANSGQKDIHDEFRLVEVEEQQKLSNLRRTHRLRDEQEDAEFVHRRIQARMTMSRRVDPQREAMTEYIAYAQAGQKKIDSLQEFRAASDASYDAIATKANDIYQRDVEKNKWALAEYKKAVGEKLAAETEFSVQRQKLQNEIDQHLVTVIDAHNKSVEQAVEKWGSAFDKIGSDIENTIGQAIKSAFAPMQPQFSWTTTQGPHGQPLMVPHRIDPTTQLLGSLGMSVGGDLAKQLGSSISESIAKSLSGGTASSFGQFIAKSVGIGTPGGLFGTGLGAVSGLSEVSQQVATTANTTAVAALTAAVSANTAALLGETAAAGAQAAGSTVSGIGSAAGAASGIGGFFKTVLSFIPGFSGGGIVGGIPSAANGMLTGSFGGGQLSMLHQKEMVLPEHLSTGIQRMIASGGGGDTHLHLHSAVMDAPSISRWFRDNMVQNSGAIRTMFRDNALTPRNL